MSARKGSLAGGRRSAVVLALLLVGFFLRAHALADLPPGWRDDEVIETTVHAQRVLDGELPLFFREASGHEPLYHWLSALAIVLWGRGLFQVRLVSALFGLLALAAHYRLARRLLGPRAALIATAALAASFWALMYSRVKIRHVSSLVFVLLAFDWVVREFAARRFEPPRREGHEEEGAGIRSFGNQELGVRGYVSRFTHYALRITHYVLRTTHHALRTTPYVSRFTHYASRITHYAFLPPLLASIFLAASLYTYFAARAAPVALLLFAAYLALFHRRLFAQGWRALAVTLGGAALLAVPLALAIRAEPAAQSRLDVVGGPWAALLAGDPRPALSGTLTTLGMFGWAGDPEALYNLPGRPVFGPLGAALFGLGLLVCLWRVRDWRYAFILLWLGAGLAPAFVSTPAASLGHAIVALPAVYLLLAAGLEAATVFLARRFARLPLASWGLRLAPWALWLVPCVLSLAVIAARDLRDYFTVWPNDPQVRRLYRADIHAAAGLLRDAPVADVALTGRLSLWDARALELDAPHLRARWFNPEGALLYPAQTEAPLIVFADPPPSDWAQALIAADFEAAPASSEFDLWLPRAGRGTPAGAARAEWLPGLQLIGFSVPQAARPGETLEIEIVWRAAEDYTPPAPVIGASPDAPPQPFTTFLHILAPGGEFVAGYDRFDANGFRLRPGDVVVQRYLPALPEGLAPGAYTLAAGLYDPATQARFTTTTGADSFPFAAVQVWP